MKSVGRGSVPATDELEIAGIDKVLDKGCDKDLGGGGGQPPLRRRTLLYTFLHRFWFFAGCPGWLMEWKPPNTRNMRKRGYDRKMPTEKSEFLGGWAPVRAAFALVG